MEHIYLAGTEQIQQAAQLMQDAAQLNAQTMSQFNAILLAHQSFMDDWLERLDDTLRDRAANFQNSLDIPAPAGDNKSDFKNPA